jgi:copper(I)-binding protein
MKSKSLIGLAALFFAAHVSAGEITVDDAWARATAPGQENGSVGMVITSQKEARLIAVSSTAAANSEIHTMTMDSGVMKMRQIEDLPLPAKQAVKLGPGGEHLMLIGLKKPLKEGDMVTLTLTVQYADKRTEKIKVNALVKSLTGGHGHHQH